jgi:hypothetical protein
MTILLRLKARNSLTFWPLRRSADNQSRSAAFPAHSLGS